MVVYLNTASLVGLPVSGNEGESEAGSEVSSDAEGKSGLVLGGEGNVLLMQKRRTGCEYGDHIMPLTRPCQSVIEFPSYHVRCWDGRLFSMLLQRIHVVVSVLPPIEFAFPYLA